MADNVVDCQVQVWDPATVHYPWMAPELARSGREWRVADVEPGLREQEVHRVVLVPSADNRADTEHMLFQALTSPRVAGVVAWVPLAAPDEAAQQLHAWRHEPVVGVGHRLDDESDPDWLLRPAVDDGLAMLTERGLTFDVPAGTPRRLAQVAAAAERHPKLTFVVSGMGRPAAAAGGGPTDGWSAQVRDLGQLPNVVAKVAALGTGWSSADAQQIVDVALEAFGADRVVLGSGWPGTEVAGTGYGQVWASLRGTLAGLDERDRALVLGGTANRVYGLPLE